MGALLSYMGQIDYRPTTFIGSPYADFASTVNPAGAQNVTGALSYQWFKDPQNPAVHNDAALVQYRDRHGQVRAGRRRQRSPSPSPATDLLRPSSRRCARRMSQQRRLPRRLGLALRRYENPMLIDGATLDRRAGRASGAPVPAARVRRYELGPARRYRRCRRRPASSAELGRAPSPARTDTEDHGATDTRTEPGTHP